MASRFWVASVRSALGETRLRVLVPRAKKVSTERARWDRAGT